ncbi:Transcription initiation factor TFIID subunit 3 [Nymphon striatum]|nr:Transcription initiation factor TFIID subunit 3 [Nymphon striatum]
MADRFCYDVLKVIVGQVCQNIGWHAIQSTPLEVMIDILHRYLLELPRTTHRYCEQFGRTEPNLDDLGLAFQDLNISIPELIEYIHNVDLINPPYEIPKFPIPRPNRLNLEPEEDDSENIEEKQDEHLSKSSQSEDQLVQGRRLSSRELFVIQMRCQPKLQYRPHTSLKGRVREDSGIDNPLNLIFSDELDDETQVGEEGKNGSGTLHSLLSAPNNQEESKNLLKRCPETNITPPQSKRTSKLSKGANLSEFSVTCFPAVDLYYVTMAKRISKDNEPAVKEIDKSVSNKFRWDWLDKTVKLTIKTSKGSEEVTEKIGDFIAKIDVPGKAQCLYCNETITCGSRGRCSFTEHSSKKKHLEIVALRRANYSLGSAFKVTPGIDNNARLLDSPTESEPLTPLNDRKVHSEVVSIMNISSYYLSFSFSVPRMMNEEELSNLSAARDLTSVFMTSGGVISPAREGKLPDAKTPQGALPVAVQDLTDQISADARGDESPQLDPNDIHSNEEGNTFEEEEDEYMNDEASVKKKRVNKAKKSVSNARKCLMEPKVVMKKLPDGSAATVSNDEPDKGISHEKTKRKGGSKNSKLSKKVTNKNTESNSVSKPTVPGITPLGVKETGDNSEVKKSKSDSESSAQIDDTIESVIQQAYDSKKKKLSIAEEEDPSQDTSLDDTIEDVIQRAMMGGYPFSTATAARKSKSKDVYDFSDSGGEGAETSKKSKSKTKIATPALLLSPLLTSAFVAPPQTKKDKTSPETPAKSITETPVKAFIKVESSSKSKRRGKNRLTKAARKEIPLTILELQKFEKDSEGESLGVGGTGMKVEMNKEPAMVTSPFHNPPGFPCRPPLPVLSSFNPSLQPSFTTNLGPPPPAHQGSSSSSSVHHPSMITSSQFYPSFPRSLPNLPQFGDLSISRPPSFSSGLSSSSFSGMVPTPAHTPQPKFYSSSLNNNFTSYDVSSPTASDHKPIVPSSPSNNDNKLPLDVQVISSSFPKSQTSPTLVVSVRSEPLSDVSASPKIEIKSSIFSSAGSGEKEETRETLTVLSKSKNESKAKSKEHKKDKKEKSAKKEKGKRGKDKKDKAKDLREELILESITGSANITHIEKQIVSEVEPPVVSTKKEKSKSKDKRKNKAKEIENQQSAAPKDEPLQKIKLKIGIGGAGGESKCYIQQPSPTPVEVPKSPTPPPPPAPKSPTPPPAAAPPPPPPPVKITVEPKTPAQSTRGRKKGVKLNPTKITPPKKLASAAAPSPSEKTYAIKTETVGTSLDDEGNKIWICPTCGCPDDGSAMIGCDSCDDWYHWICVKIVVPPKEEDSWFCTRCISKQQEQLSARSKKKKKHKKDR